MKKNSSQNIVLFSSSLLLTAMLSSHAFAANETLECTLYAPNSTDSDTQTAVELAEDGSSLRALRRAGVCLFADGSVAEKQFVFSNHVKEQGALGNTSGFSVYTFANGDEIHTQFTGGWDANGFIGNYTITGGSGAYQDASGDGSFSNLSSPWETTNVFKITLNVTTP